MTSGPSLGGDLALTPSSQVSAPKSLVMSSLVTESRQVYSSFPPLSSFFRNVPRYALLIHLKTQILSLSQGLVDAIALIDCGAQAGIINTNFVQKNSLSMISKIISIIFILIDDEDFNNDSVMNYFTFTLHIEDHQESIIFDVSYLFNKDLLLKLS